MIQLFCFLQSSSVSVTETPSQVIQIQPPQQQPQQVQVAQPSQQQQQQQQTTQVFMQIVGANGEVQNVPVSLLINCFRLSNFRTGLWAYAWRFNLLEIF